MGVLKGSSRSHFFFLCNFTRRSSSSYYSPHRCKFNSKRQSSTLNSIQKDKKGPRFPRHIAPTRKWARSSCISFSRESLLYTPRLPPSKLQLQGELRANSVRTTRELRARTHPRTTRRARLISYPKLVRRAQKIHFFNGTGLNGLRPPSPPCAAD